MMMGEALKEVEIHLLLMSHIFRDNQRPQCHIDSIRVMIFLYIISRQTRVSVFQTLIIFMCCWL